VSADFSPLEALEVFAGEEVDFVVIGGVALSLHGSALVTGDTDIFYRRSRDNVGRLARALSQMEIRLRDVPGDVAFSPDARALWAGMNFTFTSRFGDLDVMGEVKGVDSYHDVAARAIATPLGGHQVLLAAIDDLITMKRAVGRSKDLRAVDDLEAMRGSR